MAAEPTGHALFPQFLLHVPDIPNVYSLMTEVFIRSYTYILEYYLKPGECFFFNLPNPSDTLYPQKLALTADKRRFLGRCSSFAD
jgi:hypothetical protein